ncbi:GNAT family N-acetyltransferase [Glaciibacter psychrotolerans]|uniref:Ribosomal protein S18 acetylase RimI-like enzyme n=1 Tax=Glaciibacter psychrotolerans TaxID=670054 RepID=A0A7Z0EBF9_9MICO|nr:GNAT family N-acetyltransferase [Leifsonia psychrotolerans]NYJ18376.1 ribosomal protein S18 acetylase RimI-like enzyme [Leifsonia psychrotolerans]
MSEMHRATWADLPSLYRICFETAERTPTGSLLHQHPDLLGHVYVGPYLVREPDLCFVVADEAGVGGYLLGTADTRGFEDWAEAEWWPALRLRYPDRGGSTSDDELIRQIHAPVRAPESVVADFPAHLHIDLMPRLQGHGSGRALIDAVLAEFRGRDVPGVHLNVGAENHNAISFYQHLGFQQVEVGETSLYLGMRLS